MRAPDYIFESSWEVCNKVGGIYTVLSTRARTLQHRFTDKIIFIGPDLNNPNDDFTDAPDLFPEWQKEINKNQTFHVKVGRWNIPGTPPVILINFSPLFSKRNELFYEMWDSFHVDSSQSYGDYDESCIFAYAVGLVIEHFYKFHKLTKKKVVAHFNEWMLGMGALYLRKHQPRIATLFTTHATSIGRSIAGNGKPLYGYMNGYNGDQMARELNMVSKHSVEKQAAHYVDCFTTVSDITAVECRQLLDKAPDIVTPNGFEPDFVPSGKTYTTKRNKARKALLKVIEKLTGSPADPNAFFVSTSGRYEYSNKGIDVFIDVMNNLRNSTDLSRKIYAFVMVPAWVYAPRADLQEALKIDFPNKIPMQEPFITHWLHEMEQDKVMNFIHSAGFTNQSSENLDIFFIPCYLDGNDGIFNLPYYDLLIGMDATIFPSYYEPWGYTPLESIAFGIPTITTDLAGFGLWAKTIISGDDIKEGVAVIRRTDDNYFDVVNNIAHTIKTLLSQEKSAVTQIKKQSFELAAKAEWEKFISYYYTAYDIALEKAAAR
ncbi:MAG: glycogen/starch synthase [Tannerella sp.]|jgi:glycosyltransferase involved in cell wall biosynthesis|nr:glycogen/starch synthase [Tannerella sp.]